MKKLTSIHQIYSFMALKMKILSITGYVLSTILLENLSRNTKSEKYSFFVFIF